MKISLVISTYNGSRYIVEQLDSIRNQTLQPDEVIIRDDCSTDNTLKIIQKYIRKHNLGWRVTLNEKNLGYKENFYQCIKETSGDYIFLCDQDDVWKSTKIQIMIDVFTKHPEIWTLNCGIDLINGNGEKINVKCEKNWLNCSFLYCETQLEKLNYFTTDYILRHNIGPGCAMAIDRRTANSFLRTYNRALPHDWHMNIIGAINNGCAFLDEQLVHYRRHNNNTIGASNGALKGIRTKTRSVRVEDYKSRISAYSQISNYYNNKENIPIKETLALIKKMISFYSSPSPKKLIELKRIDKYRELSKNKVRAWEIFVALNLDTLIWRIVNPN